VPDPGNPLSDDCLKTALWAGSESGTILESTLRILGLKFATS
jgi:hypothetical protein